MYFVMHTSHAIPSPNPPSLYCSALAFAFADPCLSAPPPPPVAGAIWSHRISNQPPSVATSTRPAPRTRSTSLAPSPTADCLASPVVNPLAEKEVAKTKFTQTRSRTRRTTSFFLKSMIMSLIRGMGTFS
ncbi:hypothetical protein R3P38DRAFT_3180002 [Favolaschia claudopus]|uniref:Uncharacterized protein n=1 Tax=Favolaschia claudopus TaxID=2862362 RepID=A0AAW0CQR6_9AGAR